jgi:pimeloyl-ACP methyl ester carboxylesterase
MSERFANERRRFLSSAAVAALAAGLPREASAETALGAARHVEAGLLRVGYFELGPSSGLAVILLHGFPYDVHSYVAVAPRLAAAGYRVIVPHLRGHGSTRFLSAKTLRNGQQSAVALDIVALMDALDIERPILAGYDWGARTANVIAALWPDRCKAMVSVNGYLINDLERNKRPLPPRVEWGWWYQYYFATERGRAGLEAHRRELAKLIWTFNSPNWAFDAATFERTAASFDNPDYVSTVVHNYRWRLGLAAGERRYQPLEKRLADRPIISVPTITLDGGSDGVVAASDGSAQAALFSGRRRHRVVAGAGHNLPQEAPRAFVDAVLEVASY